MQIIASISTLKSSSKNCGRNEVFDLVQTSLDPEITRKTFDELQNMVESNAVNLRAIGDRECLSLSKEQAKDADAINNRTKKGFEVFQLQLGKFESSLYEQFISYEQSFITHVSQFKSDFLYKKSTRNVQNSTEKLLHQTEKKITFLHEELKSKNIIITLLLESVVKLKDESRSIHSNNEVKITQSQKNNTMETEITLTESLNIIVNDSDARSGKSNQFYNGDKSSNLNDIETSQNKRGTNRKKTLTVGDSTVKIIERLRLNKRKKSSVAVKSIPGTTTKGMKHHVKGCLQYNSPDSIILRA